ncbi:MAG: glycosyl hydrolase 115 family protein [Prevotella sp.]|nr:glycosyl hydrolase 115 family protein [Prevotella sp.]
MHDVRKHLVLFALSLMSVAVSAAGKFVLFQSANDAIPLHHPCVSFDSREHSCVKLAIENFQKDYEKVTGQPCNKQGGPYTMVVGTVGSNKQIDKWVKQGVLRDLKGKTEKYIIKTVGDQLVIAGSDKRGTVYGIYELTRQMGVSPWTYWADVPVERHEHIYIQRGEYTDGEPDVRYRGIFLNDEAPCLTSWVKHTFGTNYGDHRFYEKVFELILRLKGNCMWPAMWMWSFYADDPENLVTADRMGIMMGTSHHEPMARNHQEYARRRKEWGPWNYHTNKDRLDTFFREGIERMKNTDDIVTIGMRGDGDEAMSAETDTKLMLSIVDNQRRIIKEVTGKPAEKTPQVWALYKEVLDYYDKGMRVPDDVLILLCDDNWGNVRRVPNAAERNHPGGWGLYYHVDYVGAPRNTKWLNVTPTQNMHEQLSLAYDHGIRKMWILNVGDLKPMEYPIDFFFDMAWNSKRYSAQTVTEHTRQFCAEQFGEPWADKAAELLNQIGWLNGRVTAEMLNADTYNIETGEWQQVVGQYLRLETEALRLYLRLPRQVHDAYRQLILFPIQAMTNLYQMYEAVAMNHYLACLNDPSANEWARKAAEYFHRDSLLCAEYNNDIAGGKWKYMMTQKHIGYTSWNDDFPHDTMPEVMTVETPGEGGYSFHATTAYVAMEAAHYYSHKNAPGVQWTELPFIGRTLSGMAVQPYTSPVGDASLTYRFSLHPMDGHTDTYDIHIVVKSTLDYLNKGGLEYEVTLDDGEPVTVNFNHNLNEQPENIYSIYYPTIARRVVESIVSLPATRRPWHTLTLHPKDPGIVFEKIVVDAGGYQPSYLFMKESPKTR